MIYEIIYKIVLSQQNENSMKKKNEKKKTETKAIQRYKSCISSVSIHLSIYDRHVW